MSFSFLKIILASIDPKTWMLYHGMFFQPTLRMLYKCLAGYIRMHGLLNLGSPVSGDEKLFRSTGNSCYIKLVPSKPSRIGLWMYQLVAQLSNGLPILIHMRMQAVETVRRERALVHEVVRGWRSVIDSFSYRCILVFDSYYFSADSVSVLEEPLACGRPSSR